MKQRPSRYSLSDWQREFATTLDLVPQEGESIVIVAWGDGLFTSTGHAEYVIDESYGALDVAYETRVDAAMLSRFPAPDGNVATLVGEVARGWYAYRTTGDFGAELIGSVTPKS